MARRPFKERPVVFVWDGDVMIPLPRFKRLCDQQFAVHEEYPLMIVENRSMASHNHYFAALNEAWENLAEEYDGQFKSPEHLRAWALVETGFASETIHVMDSAADARKMMASIKRNSPFAIVRISENVVQEYHAESQSMAVMKKERFEASKKAVLDLIASMARTTPAELRKNAGRSA